MKQEELMTLRNKVDELQAVLLFGKRALPFLEDTFAFVKNIIPVVEAMKASVDATSDKLPRASKQLDTVTHATEMASTEILNTLETMFGKLERMMARYQEYQTRAAGLAPVLHVIDSALDPAGPDDVRPEALRRMKGVWKEHCMFLQTFWAGFPESLQGLQADCTSIMMSLQVQDITAQQIAAVNKMMQSVDEGLNRLMRHFADVPADHDPQKYNHAHLALQFDVDADFFGSADRQRAADALIENVKRAGEVPLDTPRPGQEGQKGR